MAGGWITGLAYGALLWVLGFVTGGAVMAIPGVGSLAEIRGVTPNPVVSASVLAIWLLVAPVLARRFYRRAGRDGRRVGWPRLAAIYVGANLVLDYLVLGIAMGWGLTFFKFASIWLAYGILALVAWRAAPDARSRDYATVTSPADRSFLVV